MSTDLCEENVVVHLTSPQIITTETIVAASSSNVADVVTVASSGVGISGSRVQQTGGVELGRRLLLAARCGDTATVLDLMAKGAPFTTDWLGTSPLHLAAANKHVETCAVLLRAGVSRDSRTKVERTPLHLAAHAGHADVVALLLEHGAMVDCRDMLQMTPLHWAAARGHEAAARELLRRGASTRARCKFRKTPRCLALRAHHTGLVTLLDAAEELSASEKMNEEPSKPQQEFKTIQRIQEIKPQARVKIQPEKKIIIESKTEPVPASAGVGRGDATVGAGGAAALLRAHGITLLPTDRGCTVLSALRSGRTVVLSDAGKLMLKESSTGPNETQILNNTSTTRTGVNLVQVNASASNIADNVHGSAPGVGQTFSAGNVTVDSADPNAGAAPGEESARRSVRARALKVLTLNKNQPLKRVIHPNDLQQVKVVRMSGATKSAAGGRSRPALKIVLDKAHLHKLLASTNSANNTTVSKQQAASLDTFAPTQSSTGDYVITETVQDSNSTDIDMSTAGDNIVRVPEQFVKSSSTSYLRSQLIAAHAAIANLSAELRTCQAKLAKYEKN